LADLVARGANVVTHPPPDESGMLLRVVGPACASFTAALLASTLADGFYGELARVPDLFATAAERVRAVSAHLEPEWLTARVAFVTAGPLGEAYHAPSWKWLEGLSAPLPPCWDVLEVAHGAYQQFYEERMLLIALEHDLPAERALFDRLASMLVPERHVMLRLRSDLPRHLAPLDHDAQVTALLLRALTFQPRDLFTWPAMGLDAPLYGLDAPP
jgi:hypothetical protein